MEMTEIQRVLKEVKTENYSVRVDEKKVNAVCVRWPRW